MLQSWSIGRRLATGFGVVLAALVILAVLSGGTLSHLTTRITEYREASGVAARAATALEHLSNARIGGLRLRMVGNMEAADKAIAELAMLHDNIPATIEAARSEQDVVAALRQAMDKVKRYRDELIRLKETLATQKETLAKLHDASKRLQGQLADIATKVAAGGDTALALEIMDARTAFLRARMALQDLVNEGAPAHYEAATGEFARVTSVLADAGTAPNVDSLRTQLDASSALLAQIAGLGEQLRKQEELSRHIGEQELDVIGPRLLKLFYDVVGATTKRRDSIGPQMAEAAAQGKIASVVLGVSATLLGVFAAWFFARSISNAVRQQAEAMRHLADGDLDVVVNGAAYRHELGAMARALETFRENARAVAAADGKAAAARAKMMSELQDAFGKVVDSAVAGDFSARVTVQFPDPELNELGEGMNRLLETVEAGVAEASRVIGRMAEGDLTATMSGAYAGAFAALQTDMNATVSKLSALVDEITGAASEVRASSSEIASGASQVSQRAEKQAAALEETSATMEEMASSVRSNAEHANEAAKLSEATARQAGEGQTVVEAAQVAMNEIETSSERISEIVGMIDSIAFTTNLLALNASVEAARAGEAGRGFAVVASEVRSLAQRSADAAKDIRTLIDESRTHVGEGVEQVGKTRTSLESIVSGVASLSAAIGEISRSSKEQTVSIDEVASAVSQMDQMTQSNAALAEQSASNAGALSEQAVRLTEAVSFFSTGDGRRQGYRIAAE